MNRHPVFRLSAQILTVILSSVAGAILLLWLCAQVGAA